MTYQQIDAARQVKDGSVTRIKLGDDIDALLDTSRNTATVTTTSLAEFAEWSGLIEIARGYKLLSIETTQAARVRLYVDATHRDADAARVLGDPPTGDHGCILEYVTTAGLLAAYLSPVVDGSTFETGDNVAAHITNLDPATAAITVDLLYVRTEE